jgi:hypothetical protein
MTETRWTHAKGWLYAFVLVNLAASMTGLADEDGGLWILRTVLLGTAVVLALIYTVKLVRWRAPD